MIRLEMIDGLGTRGMWTEPVTRVTNSVHTHTPSLTLAVVKDGYS